MEYNKKEIEEKLGLKPKTKRKIRAWCSLCFQSFDNGPYTKSCKDHIKKGNCSLVGCKKTLDCIRKFANTNSENRHTYCLTKQELSDWDQNINIQIRLKISENEIDTQNPPEEISNEVMINRDQPLFDKINESNHWEISDKIDNGLTKPCNIINNQKDLNDKYEYDGSFTKSDICQIKFIKSSNDNSLIKENSFEIFQDKYRFVDEDSLVDELSKMKFEGTPDKNLNSYKNKNSNKLSLNLNQNKDTIGISQVINSNVNYYIKDDTIIEEILDIVHKETKIPKISITKTKSAFKKSGFTNAKILRLKKIKSNSWNFLYEDFKDVCFQAEGLALFMGDLLDKIV